MKNIELYWETASKLMRIANMGITGYCYYRLVKPFMGTNKYGKSVGVVYFFVIMAAYFFPYEMQGMTAYGVAVFAAFMAMYRIDKRNLEQKVFLAVIMYLLDWIVHGIAIIPRRFLMDGIINSAYMTSRGMLQFGCYIGVEILYVILKYILMMVFIRIIDNVYVCKEENMSRKELGLMLSAPLLVLAGYGSYTFFSESYITDTQQYIWNVHWEYFWITGLYQVISFIAIIAMIVFYQSIKSGHGREKEYAVLTEQIENMKGHIKEVESLYGDIRGLKHDMGNHIMTLENLVQKNKNEEAEDYLTKLKEQLNKEAANIKTGNPVTDVILNEKRKEAEERGITFICDFYYPKGTKINAFDISVILHNGINNALYGALNCRKPYVSVSSYCKNNAYMIEIKNNFNGRIMINDKTGLPDTTKKNKEEHGFGLTNIRNTAQKYFGDIDIGEDGEEFTLSVMLMLK